MSTSRSGLSAADHPLALVTGANGFIGARLCGYLQHRGYPLRTTSRTGAAASADHRYADLTSAHDLPGLCSGVDTIYHLAGKAHALSEHAEDESEYRRINTEAVHKLLVAAKQAKVSRFIFFSSVKAVGDVAEISDETADAPADTAYGRSKFAAEQLVLHGGFVPHAVVIRPAMVYGNTGKGNLPRMIKAIERGVFPPLRESGNRRSMIHVDDLVRAAWLSAENPAAAGQIYIVSDGGDYSTRQLYDMIRTALGRPPRKWSVPLPLIRAAAGAGDVFRLIGGRRLPLDSDSLQKLTGSASYSAAKIRRELGFVPGHTLQQALPDIVRYLETG